ncbi:MAG: alpha/beta hydrolase [Oscillospiraceae bacterium]|nr:alpha/beta hydrolase [Oscillospiraceae bacterium]
MTIHEFGQNHDEVVVLVHPSVVMWDYFEYVIPLMQEQYHLVIPALPGYDTENNSDFTSVEEISKELSDWLIAHGHASIACIYGCSMGGAVVTRFLADGKVKARSAVIDGGITPYQLPWIVTRLIAVKDFLLISMGKVGGLKILQKAFSTDEYSEEDLQYIVRVLKHMSAKTIWRTFESCNNYAMPKPVTAECERIEYWYAKAEEKDRKGDIAYIKKNLPQAVFRVFEQIGHGGLAALKPELLASELIRVMGRKS